MRKLVLSLLTLYGVFHGVEHTHTVQIRAVDVQSRSLWVQYADHYDVSEHMIANPAKYQNMAHIS